MIKTSLNNFRFKLLVIFVLFLLLVKIFYSKQYILILFNTLIEVSILYLIFLFFKYIRAHLKNKTILMFESIIYYTLFYFNVLLFTITSYYFDDAIIMKYSFFQLDLGHISFFINSILQIWLVVFFIVISLALTLVSFKKWKKVVYSGLLLIVVPLIVFVSSFFGYAHTNNVYTISIQDMYTSLTQEYVSIEPMANYTSNFSPDVPVVNFDKKNQRVLIFMMEQTTYDEFTKGILEIPEEINFFEKIKHSSHWYTNYYTNNQDSRTSIWSMLFSKTIPFEAYSAYWDKEYGSILDSTSPIDVFNRNNYSTTAVASMYEPSLILGAFNWSNSIFLEKYPYSEAICIHEFEYQKGCEDNVILPRVIKEISNNEEVFLFQELIYGHGEKYLQQGEKSRVEYYNEYLFEIYSYLEKTNKLENTTIIITSDHGNKGYYSKKISDYQIPFIVYNSQLNYQENSQLYSHLYFNNLLFSYLMNSSFTPQKEVFIQGQTQSGELAYINTNGSFYTIEEDLFKGYKIVDTNKNISFIKEKVSGLLGYKEKIKQTSSNGNYSCVYCSKNSEVIKSQRKIE